MKRRGFALVSAVVISAFLMVAIVGVSAILTSQLRSQAQEGLSRKAFYDAEAALQRAFSAACDTGDTTGIYAALSGATPARFESAAAVVAGDSNSFTWIKAKPVFAGATLLRYEFVAEGVVCDKNVSALSSAQLKAGTGYSVLSRRVIQLQAGADFASKGGNAFDYGLFAGSGIIQNGKSSYHAPEGPVDVYAGTNINMKTSSFDAGIDIYAHGTVDVKSYSGVKQEHAEQVTLPPIDLAYWQTQFKAFLNGTAPYDGSDPAHMNTSSPLVRAAIASYLTGKNVTVAGYSGYLYTTAAEVAGLWQALSQPAPSGAFGTLTATQYKQLHDTFSKTAFYVQDTASSLNATVPDHAYAGVLVCPGTLSFDGHGGPPYSTGAVFVSKGSLTFNGRGTFQGTFYTEGTFLHNGSTSELYGSVIALQGDIHFNGASKDTNLVNYAAGVTELESEFSLSDKMGSGWSEVDLSTFSGF